MGTIAQIFESGEQASQKGHFRNLILIARLDGKMHENESKYLQKIANNIGLTEEQIKEIVSQPDQYPFVPPYSKEDRYERFIHLIQMALADGDLPEQEGEFIKRLGINLGFTAESVEEHYNFIKEKILSGASVESILNILL